MKSIKPNKHPTTIDQFIALEHREAQLVRVKAILENVKGRIADLRTDDNAFNSKLAEAERLAEKLESRTGMTRTVDEADERLDEALDWLEETMATAANLKIEKAFRLGFDLFTVFVLLWVIGTSVAAFVYRAQLPINPSLVTFLIAINILFSVLFIIRKMAPKAYRSLQSWQTLIAATLAIGAFLVEQDIRDSTQTQKGWNEERQEAIAYLDITERSLRSYRNYLRSTPIWEKARFRGNLYDKSKLRAHFKGMPLPAIDPNMLAHLGRVSELAGCDKDQILSGGVAGNFLRFPSWLSGASNNFNRPTDMTEGGLDEQFERYYRDTFIHVDELLIQTGFLQERFHKQTKPFLSC